MPSSPSARSPSAALSPLLEGWLGEMAAIRADAAAQTADLTEAQFHWRPEPGVWSAAQIADHLATSGALYLERVERAVGDARARGQRDRGDWKPSLVGRLMVSSMEPPPKRKFKAPRVFRPAEGAGEVDGAAALAAWSAVHARAEECIRSAAGVDLRRARVVSPVSRFVRMNAGDAIRLVLAHERRHLWQLRRLLGHAGFPPG